jgi:hypothetical protein
MTRRPFLLILLAGLALALFGCSRAGASGSAPGELKSLTVDEVATRIAANDGKTFVYDNNSRDSWTQGHVPGAKWVDYENVTAADLPADKTATLVFYCHNEA